MLFSAKGVFFQNMKQGGGGEIDHGMAGIQQFFGNTIGEISFANPSIAIEKQVAKFTVKGFDKFQAGMDRILCSGQTG